MRLTEGGAYLTQLLEMAGATASGDSALQVLRSAAAGRVQSQQFPTTRDEEWRFTDLADLLKLELITQPATVADISPYQLAEAPYRLTFVNGRYLPELSQAENLPDGLNIGNLAGLPDLQQYLAQQGAEELFTALNTAGLNDAAVVHVRKYAVVPSPIHLLFISTADQFTQPRALIVAEANSSVTLIEEHLSLSDTPYFTNSVTEVFLADSAEVNHSRIQRDADSAFHIGKTAVSQMRGSRYTCNAVSLGAKLSRHHLEIYQTGEQTETTLNGLTVLRGEQVGDTHSTIALTHPHGTTRQLHKTIIDDRAHGVFNGKVYVPQAAQLTNAGQLNRNLLLSPKARIDTKPQLEIVADNVKCTHGATVGQLETDEVFYLQSRGIDADSARKLLVNAFAYEVISQIPVDSLQQTLSRSVTTR
ncbi:MAG: Fe-S cluster assembly protein SufD [Pegethrix bostrychoides GSE-TBD4-15B]|jgi:Fe-S cluster assembly protein SufD|uniref:Fe-S cluster assembly protein SufD n=1 Tax=Pegethrix bostrychoides GSE-TBD4-15B TaxID=2839662 RepID=A0A951P8A1_9CYAN|nr:Fe-S cluster assembly protein SufD [Pegethrix bostrychoides GSE-TBD4-15B]